SATEKDRDGAVIQYTNVNGQWTTLGLPNQGVNWYNSVYISGSPAGQTFGWTGNSSSFVDSAEWKTAMFWLDQLKGRESVRFRIVFGSDAAATDEGFAFDNIWIGERKRIVLLENFVNSTDDHSAEINNEVINPIVVNNPLDVIAVNYHTSFPGLDKMNIFYASGPSARTLFYGISKVPYSVMDGGERQYSYLFTDYLTENDLKARMLIEPDFNISLNNDIQDNRLLVSSTIKARNHFSKSINAQIAIVEKSVESDSKVYNNVLRAMLPDAAGTLIDKDWGIGDSVKVYQTWDIPDEVNPDSLISVIFIQDEVSKEVYQTAFTGELSTITSINNLILPNNAFDFVIYPNPASDNIIIWLANKLHDDLNVYIYNTTGKLVHTGIINKESEFLEMNVNNLTSGIYYVKLTNNESIVRTKKLIINN
ncbi:MAG: T9SS type A sorting domain-containing protein, partial [Bacteroidota bacterium]